MTVNVTGEQIENSFANPVFHAETSSNVVHTSVTSSNPLPVSFPTRVVMVTVVALRPLDTRVWSCVFAGVQVEFLQKEIKTERHV